MDLLNTRKTALSVGLTAVMWYLGCVLLMSIGGKTVTVWVSNLLFHGVEFENIVRMRIPFIDTLLGLILTFVLWTATGWFLATVYNKLNVK